MSDAEIGILCLQGDYEAHGRVLEKLGVRWVDVRQAQQLVSLRGLVLPGGESTTMWHLLRQGGLEASLHDFHARGGVVYGTCAGAILLATEVLHPAGHGLGFLDMSVERNSYGRQVRSAVRQAEIEPSALGSAPAGLIEAVLIRAPRIVRIGPRVRVLARLDGDPVWVEQGKVMATTFHPELSASSRPHERFVQMAMGA
jgi:5'-phosphate synthase pdxT subunit